jgi:D-glycero-alpha-D-manno-heptose-7-phosphate kinase
MIVSRTPLRISLGGGGTDLPFYANKHGGSLVSAAINKYIYLTVSPRIQKNIKLNYSETEVVESVDDIKHPLIRESLRLVKINDPIEIHSTSEVPPGSGLGSSFSFLVGLLNALYYYKGNIVSKYKLADDASHITMDILKEPCGKQDQYACAYGGLNHLMISTNGKVTVTPVNISHENLQELEANLLMFYTGFNRSANEILSEQKKKSENKSDSDIFEFYDKIKKIGEDSLTCLESGDLKSFGRLMNTHWELKRGITNKMSNDSIDRWYRMALKHGALGGKIIGAGGGGFLLLFADHNHDKIKTLMAEEGLIYTPFKFDFDGSRIVYDGKHF